MIAEGPDSATTLAQGSAAISATLLRGPADAGAGQEAVTLGPLQLLVILGLTILLVLLAILVIWRIRQTRSK